MSKTIDDLVKIIKDRKNSDISQSYTASLAAKGLDKCVKKMDEEFIELKSALKDDANIVHESADLIYHLLVTLVVAGVDIQKVWDELESRKKKSGIEEKKSRKL